MKKRILCYIGWDVIFFLILFISVMLEKKYRAYFVRYQLNITLYAWLYVLCIVIMGAALSLFLYWSRRTHFRLKDAICEFIFVGIPSFVVATAIALPASLAAIINKNTLYYSPFFFQLLTSKYSIMMGSLLFGIELVVLIIRIIEFRTIPNQESLKEIQTDR
ncbi:hypothetical protein [Sinanaerobacter sp. ZZT-01]|uniref:hypothetical protein n=1 Tax=Sinanaerobacter sp. ZZT-01 TaxID=3111540 RepID=UPI002D78B621|nr:hypothetical protein [Sinanaerobacter sp. ZZT-01]WRR94370.1 hypothetical protein U5921_04440 [Sinanaerobacter sp. ZZT-01]